MHLLVTGRGSSGSWKIRAEQLGAAIGATVLPRALDVGAFDAAIVVKRCPEDVLERLHAEQVPIIWDIVDAWPQPAGNDWNITTALQWLSSEVKRIKPRAIVAATRAMREDCARFGLPCLWLPHHGRPGIEANPIREQVQRVGYEGGQYLGAWEGWLEAACASRGWTFHVNPPALAELDIVVAFRDSRGYPATHWKSNVKLANAQASGTPCILQADSGYAETACGAEAWAASRGQLEDALTALQPAAVRRHASGELLASAPLLPSVAATYRAWLSKLSF